MTVYDSNVIYDRTQKVLQHFRLESIDHLAEVERALLIQAVCEVEVGGFSKKSLLAGARPRREFTSARRSAMLSSMALSSFRFRT